MKGKTIRELTIVSEIGEGGMATVYLAEHSVLGRVAVKVFDPLLGTEKEFRERFKK